MERKVYIDFNLKTKMAPKLITKLIGVIPDRELLRGETKPKLNIPRQNIWSLESKIDSEDISLHWDEIESQIGHAKEDIKTIIKDGFGCVTIVILTEGYIPKIIIPAKMSQFLGYVNAMIDIDHIQCPAQGINIKITLIDSNESIREMISTVNSSEFSDHWNQIEDEVRDMNINIKKIKKLELLITNTKCIPAIQIYPKILNILGEIDINFARSSAPAVEPISDYRI